MFDLFDDLMFDRAVWRRMKGPAALAAAILGMVFGLIFAVVGGTMFVQTRSWLALAGAAAGVWLLGSTVIGTIAFLRAGDSHK
jgi:hypothetical protein